MDGAGQPVSTVISTPLSSLSVRGRATRLTFSADNVRRSVDFSLGCEIARNYGGWAGDMGSLAGTIAGGVLAGSSGVKPFVEALRKHGAAVKYLSYGQRLLRNIAIGVGFLVVLFGFFVHRGRAAALAGDLTGAWETSRRPSARSGGSCRKKQRRYE